MENIVLFAGPIGSGKTTIAQATAALIPKAVQVSFSDGLKMLACNENIPIYSRSDLQVFGESIAYSRWRDLFVMTLECKRAPETNFFLIDGLRHPHILEGIRSDGHKVLLLYLNPGEKIINRRRSKRGDSNISDRHVSETHHRDLERLADLSMRGKLASSSSARAIAEFIKSYF